MLELDKEESGITEPVTRSIEEEFEEAETKLEKSRLHWKIMKGLQKKNPPVVRGDDPGLLHECSAERCGGHVGHKDRSASGHADQGEELDPEDIRCRI